MKKAFLAIIALLVISLNTMAQDRSFWVDASAGVSTYGGAGMTVGVGFLGKPLLVQLRISRTQSSTLPTANKFRDIAVLAGIGKIIDIDRPTEKAFIYSVTAGVGFARDTQCINNCRYETGRAIYRISNVPVFPIEGNAVFKFKGSIGVGIKGTVNLNSSSTFASIGMVVQLGSSYWKQD